MLLCDEDLCRLIGWMASDLIRSTVCTENLIRVDGVMESPELAE